MNQWRVGTKIPINVYEGDRPICQCHTAIDAKRIVEAMNSHEALLGVLRLHDRAATERYQSGYHRGFVEPPWREGTAPHIRVGEYDGAFKCLDCKAQWGALPGNPAMPTVCIPPED